MNDEIAYQVPQPRIGVGLLMYRDTLEKTNAIRCNCSQTRNVSCDHMYLGAFATIAHIGRRSI